MNGNQDTIPGIDVPGPSSPGLGWDEFSRELVEFFASIKAADVQQSGRGARKG